MVHQIILRKSRRCRQSLVRILLQDQFFQIALEIPDEYFVVLGGQQLQNVPVVFLQMAQKMQKDGVRAAAAGIVVMPVWESHGGINDVPEQFLAQILQQIFLCLKMGIECGAAYIGPVDDVLHGDLIAVLFRQQFCKRLKNSFSGLFLPSVHTPSRTVLRKCSVSYKETELILVLSTKIRIIYIVPNSSFRIGTSIHDYPHKVKKRGLIMLKKINDILAGVPATIIAGLFLLLDLVPHMIEKFGSSAVSPTVFPFDPAWVTVVISGIPMLYLAVWRVIHNPGIRKISSALLISIAMIASIAIGDRFAAGEVAWIMAIGAILEDMTTERAKKGLKKLISLAPTQGRRIADGKEELIPAEKIAEGDILRILPGEVIPVDGVILSGETSVDQSIITGESLPVDKAVGDGVFCGTINRFGSIDIRATMVGEDSSLQKLIRMVQEAEDKKAPTARIADIAASWLVPAALLIAVIAGIVTKDIVRAVTVLVVFCPCALVLATPTAIMAAIGQATRHGVIIKSGEALEKMGRVNTVAFDKTGTLTYGRLEVSDVIPFADTIDEDTLLSLAASAEAKSEHPLGKAITACAAARGAAVMESAHFRMTAGKGISAAVAGKQLFCGSEAYLEENGVTLSDAVRETVEALRTQGKASVLAAEGGRCIGVLAMADVLRPEAGELVARLHSMHTDIVLLTGDNRKTADYFAAQVGIRQIRAQLLPEEKVSSITAIQKEGKTVCMIGDGVNDAPALKTADVGVAMGGLGSDIAVEAADVVLMHDDISRLPYLKRLSNATVGTIRFSIALSMCINILAVVLSVLGVLTPTTGALVHNAGSCFVVLIAALLYDRKLD